ncbi:spore coat protein [Pradoshia sp. D12]|uniref:spore coat protein n=1 Tax=Bacillaceae TaxID=186817 RepID=UPI00111D8952|nr:MULTISPECIES: spore coat protein [Bacillaceae]QFK71752.1 spore coat protein [Pradoshia sp. D12]TPF73547.1 spore coat protein [Bacillus sp. D12]
MSDEKNQSPQLIPQQLINLLVSDLFRKNGINAEKAKEKLSDEQKQMIKELVSDLTNQVETFVKSSSTEDNKSNEK